MKLKSKDLRLEFYKSSGPGGQHKNKRFSAVRVTHVPSGVRAVSQGERSQSSNKVIALDRLKRKLIETFKVRKVRIPTGKSRGSQERRLAWKKKRSMAKKLRGRIEEM